MAPKKTSKQAQKHLKTSNPQKELRFPLIPNQAISVHNLPLSPTSSHTSIPLRILWDTGARGSFINTALSVHPALAHLRTPLAVPSPLTMFDGRESAGGAITHTVTLSLPLLPRAPPISAVLSVTPLADSDLVFGEDWMATHGIVVYSHLREVAIPYPLSSLSALAPITSPNNIPLGVSPSRAPYSHAMPPSQSPMASIPTPSPTVPSPSKSTPPSKPSLARVVRTSTPSHPRSVSSTASTAPLSQTPHVPSLSSSPGPSRPEASALSPSVPSLPSADCNASAATPNGTTPHSPAVSTGIPLFRQPCPELQLQLRAVAAGTPSDLDLAELKISQPQFFEPLSPAEFKKETTDLLAILPPTYHSFLDIFRPSSGTQTLPPHRKYDMRIELIPNHKLRAAPLYRLSAPEEQVMLETLTRELAAGRIRPSNSPYGSPTFFVPKSDGRYRMVVDYRHLNRNTTPDVYPLPLIDQIMAQLGTAKYFTKLDLVGAYQLLRVAEGYEHLTAFRTQFGMFESCVVRDGLRNAPAVFQHFLNEVFRELLGRGVIIYIDDILIYSNSLEDLRTLTHRVFDLAQQASLYMKASKCEFERTSVLFLGFQISSSGITTNPKKIEAISTFPVPKSLSEARSFIGLVSYYRRFVPEFASIASPITGLTKKDIPFIWEKPQQQAFETLKRHLTSSPTLAHYNPLAKTILQTDASFFGWGFVLSQIDPVTQREHPVAIESGRFSGAKMNYSTTEKEFLAIVEGFVRCRHMLLQVHTTVLTDHHNLSFWMTPRQLSPRQARWAEILAPFSFDIVYRPGKQAVMPDALSRRSDYHEGKGSTYQQDLNFTQALPTFVNPAETPLPSNLPDARPVLRALSQHPSRPPTSSVSDRDYFIDDADILHGLAGDSDIAAVRAEMLALVCASCSHPTCQQAPSEPPSLSQLRRTNHNPSLTSPAWTRRGFLSFQHRAYVPNHNDARLKILRTRHDSLLAGHPGIAKTLELISRDYIWIGLRRDVEAYVAGCDVCQRTKSSHQRSHPHLRPLEVPKVPWRHLSMDFIEPLPPSNNFNSILVIVDRLTKWSIFIPTTTKLSAPGLATLFTSCVLSQHGLPDSIVSDRGSKFVSKFWRHLMAQLGIRLNLSTAYHPQTDGQTERVNQTVEQYLRIFTSYNQDDWDILLPQASFHYNNTLHSATRLTPFFANFGYHPRWADELRRSDVTEVPDAVRVASSLLHLHDQCAANITLANKRYSTAYNRKHTAGPLFEVGDHVLLSMENMKTTRPSKKLDYRHAGPFRVLAKISDYAYQLDIPADWHRFDIFPVSLLRPYTPPLYPHQTTTPSPLATLDNDASTIPLYRIATFLNSRNNSDSGKLEYLVEWEGLEGTAEQVSWMSPSSLTDDPRFTAAVEEFHLLHPKKPSIDISPPRPRHRRKAVNPPSPRTPIDFSPTSLSSSSATPPATHTAPPPNLSTPIPNSIAPSSSSSPPPLPTQPFRPKQPSNWKGWALIPAIAPVSSEPYQGPTSRSGRPLRRKVSRDD